ncbi:MAG TPA: hypothetical protein VFK02_03430 [Kofleriaceae bacterium]|nr:hypothetical protein [Kofleriaceae bacterium]
MRVIEQVRLGVREGTSDKVYEIDLVGTPRSARRWRSCARSPRPTTCSPPLGFASYVAMVDPAKGGPLRAKVLELRARHAGSR